MALNGRTNDEKQVWQTGEIGVVTNILHLGATMSNI